MKQILIDAVVIIGSLIILIMAIASWSTEVPDPTEGKFRAGEVVWHKLSTVKTPKRGIVVRIDRCPVTVRCYYWVRFADHLGDLANVNGAELMSRSQWSDHRVAMMHVTSTAFRRPKR